MDALRVRLLGGFRVYVGDREVSADAWRRRKAAALVKALAVAPGRRLHREHLLDRLWPDLDLDAATNQLHQTVRWARLAVASVLPTAGADNAREQVAPYLGFQGAELVLGPAAPVETDLESFEQAVRRARERLDLVTFRQAVERYTGDLLPEDRYEDWLVEPRERARRGYTEMLGGVARALEARGDAAEAEAAWHRLLEADPLIEEAHVALMRRFASVGRRQEALRQYRQLADVLRRELVVEPGPAARQLHRQLIADAGSDHDPGGPAGVPKDDPPPRPVRTNLPSSVNRFVGRREELARIEAGLRECRLLTLSGTGGVGKTRVAVEAARGLVGRYPDGVWLVEFAPIADAGLVPQAVGEVLGTFAETGQGMVEAIANQLRERSALLVLDNCEHVVDATARLAEVVLRRCPGVAVLATSREPLRIAGERVLPVPPLSLPPGGPAVGLGGLGAGDGPGSDAVGLFVDRAAAVRPEFRLTAENRGEVERICRRLDGIPLALELAAARVAVDAVGSIAEGLDDRFALLTRGSRAELPRHQTLRASLDWSYQGLREPERELFRHLAVFAGGFDLDAASAVGAPGERPGAPVVREALAGLVDKSLVTVETGRARSRYGLLETVREYAGLLLAETGELAAARDRHLTHYLTLAERADSALRRGGQREWLPRLDLERDNLRVATEWALTRAGTGGTVQTLGTAAWADAATRLATAQWIYWDVRGAYEEAWQWLTATLAVPASPAMVVSNHAAAACIARQRGDQAAAQVHVERAAAAASAVSTDADGMEAAVAFATMIATIIASDRGEAARAERLAREALAVFERRGDTFGVAYAWTWIGIAAMLGNRPDEALDHFAHTERLRREQGDEAGLSIVLLLLARLERVRGQAALARSHVQEALAIARSIGYPLIVGYALWNLGHLAILQGDAPGAARYVDESLAVFSETGHRRFILRTLYSAVLLGNLIDAPVEAAQILGSVGALARGQVGVLIPSERPLVDEAATALRERLGSDRFESASGSAAGWSIERTLVAARQLVERALAAGRDVAPPGSRLTGPHDPRPRSA